MAFMKGTKLVKTTEMDEDGVLLEVVDTRIKFALMPGASLEDARAAMIARLHADFNDLFMAELGLMPERIEEGRRWEQQRLFDDEAIREAVDGLREMGAKIGTSNDDED